jgi:hypothetical protein
MSDKTAAIIKALGQLDPANADHWTNDGLPRLDAIKGVSGLKREDVTAAAPHFTKDNPKLEAPETTGGDSTTGQGADAAPTPQDDEQQADQGDEAQDAANEAQEGDEGQAADADDAAEAAAAADQGDDDELEELPGDDEIDEAEAAVLEAKAKLEEAQDAANEAQKVVKAAEAEHDRLVEARDANRNPHQDMEDRLAFIKRQAQMRAERAGASQALLKGLDVNKLDPRSPLDRSMARKTGFGHRPRPQVPLKSGSSEQG